MERAMIKNLSTMPSIMGCKMDLKTECYKATTDSTQAFSMCYKIIEQRQQKYKEMKTK